MQSRSRFENHRGHTVIGFAPDAAPVVIDCGAHKGEFAASVTAAWQARCHSIEASPILFAEMSLPEGVKGYNFAVAGADGTLGFEIVDNAEGSHITDRTAGADRVINVPARSLPSFLAEIGVASVDVLKLDIEGAEIAAIAAMSDAQLQTIKQITVEFHDFCNYVTREEVNVTIDRLRGLGFHVFNFAFRTRGDVLIVNSRFHTIGWFERQWIRSVERVRRRFATN